MGCNYSAAWSYNDEGLFFPADDVVVVIIVVDVIVGGSAVLESLEHERIGIIIIIIYAGLSGVHISFGVRGS